MRLLWAAVAALTTLAVVWAVGGPVGAALNGPGLLLLAGARKAGILGDVREPGLGTWIWLGSILSASFWGLVVYAMLRRVGSGIRTGGGT